MAAGSLTEHHRQTAGSCHTVSKVFSFAFLFPKEKKIESSPHPVVAAGVGLLPAQLLPGQGLQGLADDLVGHQKALRG